MVHGLQIAPHAICHVNVCGWDHEYCLPKEERTMTESFHTVDHLLDQLSPEELSSTQTAAVGMGNGGGSTIDQVFLSLHCKIAKAWLRKTSTSMRSFLEHVVLLLAVSSFCVVIVAHKTFVYKPLHQHGDMLYSSTSSTAGPTVSIPCGCLRQIPDFDPDAHVTTIIIRQGQDYNKSSILMVHGDQKQQQPHQPSLSPPLPLLDTDRVLYSYSRTEGFLRLPPDIRSSHGIKTQYVLIHMSDRSCFGTEHQSANLMRFFVHHVLEDTIVMNWLLALHDGDGYILHLRNHHLVDLRFASDHLSITTMLTNNNSKGQRSYFRFLLFKCGVLFINMLVFCVTTTLVSFTLRQTQQRMIQFTFLLQLHIRNRMPFSRLIFTHIIESLVFVPITVGTIFFLIEIFLQNQLLAIMVLSIVWICEVFSAISMRTKETTRFFPKAYFLYFTLFNVYFFSCPFGFSQLSLLSTALFLTHTMLFFWNRFELPAVQNGTIHSSMPRPQRVGSYQQHRVVMPSSNGAPSAAVTTTSRSNAGTNIPPLHPLYLPRRSSESIPSNEPINGVIYTRNLDSVRRRRTTSNTNVNGMPFAPTVELTQFGSSSSLNTRIERESHGGNELYFGPPDDEADYYVLTTPSHSPPIIFYGVQR